MNNDQPTSTSREERAAAREQRRFLQAPNPLGRAELIRSRSPSPAPVGAPTAFNFPPTANQHQPEDEQFVDATIAMATQEQLDAIRAELRNEMRAELRNEAAATAAQTPDAIKRKPEIPPFDKKHIDNWIRRTENAFIRALCNTPREKFAFLETKFPVDFNPRINEFLWGDATEEKWNEFLAYLRAEYGTTKQQQAAVILDGINLDGKKPSQFAALLNEKTKDIDLDDIKKEMLVRRMPTDIQRMLQERIEDLSFVDAAKIADAYFDQDGKPRHINKSSNINSVQEPPREFTTAFCDESDDINAVGRRWQNPRNGGTQRGGRQMTQRSGPSRPAPQQKKPAKSNDPSLCFYHNEYGDRAKKCDVNASGQPCARQSTGNAKAGK